MVTTHVAEPGPSTPDTFTYPAADALDDLGGPAARFQANVAAITLLAAIERDRRLATPNEQARLARYSTAPSATAPCSTGRSASRTGPSRRRRSWRPSSPRPTRRWCGRRR